MEDVVLKVENIVKDFPGVRALKNVNFDVRTGEVHALCGENGAGKSTLMHILAGVYKPESGRIYLEGKEISINHQKHANDLGISIVYQERSLIGNFSVAENIFAGRQPTIGPFTNINFKKMHKETSKLLKELDIKINPTVLVNTLSPAFQQMVEIAKALSLKPKVLILDEPTATITEKEIQALFKLIKKLKSDGIAIIYISHRLAEIFRIADRVTVFKDGEHIATEDVKDIDNQWIISKMVGRNILFDRIERNIKDDIILECKNLEGDKFKDISFVLKRSEILSFAGLAGAGRTEAMRAIFGADRLKSGKIFINGKEIRINNCIDAINNGIGYLSENRKEEGLFLEMKLSENIVSANLDFFRNGLNTNNKKIAEVSREYIKSLNIITPSIYQKVLNLSGGNQQKVSVAKWVLVNPKILIVDEPTRGIDVGTKAEIYKILRSLANKGTSIIVISSDLPEVLSISDRIYIMHEGRIKGEVLGRDAIEDMIMKRASGIIE